MAHRPSTGNEPSPLNGKAPFTVPQLRQAVEAAHNAVDARVAIIRSENGTVKEEDVRMIKRLVQVFFKTDTSESVAIDAFKKLKPSGQQSHLQHEILKESLMAGLESLHINRRQLGLPSRQDI